MPLYKTITVNDTTTVYIWKIEESLDTLESSLNEVKGRQKLTQNSLDRLDNMKSEIHKRGFMSVRHLLSQAGYSDHDLFYNDAGKPHLTDGKHISITHSYIFSAIIISNKPVGIDIEKQRDKILRIARKFTPLEEYLTLNTSEARVRKLTIVWGAKESIYKLYAQGGLSFRKHIDVNDFGFEDAKTSAKVYYNGNQSSYTITFDEFEGFTMVYAF